MSGNRGTAAGGIRGRRVGALAVLLTALTLAEPHRPAPADVTFHRLGERSAWPAGTERVRSEVRGGLVFFRTTLRSPSGHDTSGFMVLDTGAPGVAVTAGVWNALEVDTLEPVGWSVLRRVHRPLSSVEIGSARVPNLEIGGVISDTLLTARDALGLFGPSALRDRAIVLDYAASEWAIVAPRPSLVSAETTATRSANLGRDARIRRSRAVLGSAVGPGATAVPFRLFEGGRILVSARVTEPDRAWSGQPLSLLLDTGASATMLFEDVLAERVSRASLWPKRRDTEIRTVLGSSRVEATVLPRLELSEATTPLALDRVEAGLPERRALPDLEGELPERVHGLLGFTFLRRFRLAIDYANQVLWLEPLTGPAPGDARRAQVGLGLELLWGDLRVATVAPGSPADSAGIAVGDFVVSIDGRVVTGLAVEAAQQLLEGSPGSQLTLVARREGIARVLRLVRAASRE